MPYWLASERSVQVEDVLTRFDPRFWTVNFPRPAMAAVTSIAADALRVDAVFGRAGDLVGLIWEAEDRHDHPLLAYETARDFRGCRLRFRWRSGGVQPLDAVDGAVLTIEGREADGEPFTAYVRLWNYASGTGEDAAVALDFADLRHGFGPGGPAVWAGDIDRMFVSLAPPGYVEGSAAPLAAEGWAELTGMVCEGPGSVLAIGDVVVPEHGLGIATGYDDQYHLTPARLLRNVLQLGWGTMRVAGTVIWATDLQETRTTSRGGKGRPGTTTYSYAASFAVLLSGRPIRGVGRIWADGQLLRGAAGDWKAATGFRLHLGDEEQAADPLIASAEGAALTPAHRGCAYAVFEGLALERFGNRIPSLTFEVIADDGPVGIGAVAGAIAPEVSGVAALALDGYVAAGGTVRDALAGLAEAGGAWFAPLGDGLALRDAADVREVTADLARDAREVAAADRAPAAVTVRYFEPARDWQAGMQRARRPGAGPTRALELPAALSAGAAKGIAEAALRRGAAERVRRTLGVGLEALALTPGDAVQVAGETGIWRVEAVALEGMAALTLAPLASVPAAAAASGGRALPAPDAPAGTTLLHVAELPALEDAVLGQPRLLVWANGVGAGWRRAALLTSLDGGASWSESGATAAPAVIGVVETPPGPGPAGLIDRQSVLTVALMRADMLLANADAGRLDGGANLALVGGELLQFGRAEPLGGGRWRLSELWRGRRGVMGAIAAGDRLVLVESDATRGIDLPLAALGGEVRVMATGIGDAEPVIATTVVDGASVAPPTPVALRRDGDVVRWTRRSRAGWRWLDRVDAPLAEEREAYRVTVASGGGVREATVGAAAVELLPAEVAGGVTVTVRQRGTLAESPAAAITI